MEYVNCICCNEDSTKILFEVKDENHEVFNIVKCRNCGLVFLNPRPTKQEIKNYYPSNYYTHKIKIEQPNLRSKIYGNYIRLFGNLMDWPEALKDLPKGNVLDVGCGNGKLLKELKEKGWETYGVDVDPLATKQARKLGLNVFTGELHEVEIPKDYFDVVIMKHSLEHMHNPLQILKEYHRILKPDGTLIIEVPNIKSTEAKIFREQWKELDIPRHLYHFSPYTLASLLNKANFLPTEIFLGSMFLDPIFRTIIYSAPPGTISYILYMFALPFSFITTRVHYRRSLARIHGGTTAMRFFAKKIQLSPHTY